MPPKKELPTRTAKNKLGLGCQGLNPSGDIRSACLLPSDFEPSAQPSVLLRCLVFRLFFFDAWFALCYDLRLHPSHFSRPAYCTYIASRLSSRFIPRFSCCTIIINSALPSRFLLCIATLFAEMGVIQGSTTSLPIASLTSLSVVYVPDRYVGLLSPSYRTLHSPALATHSHLSSCD